MCCVWTDLAGLHSQLNLLTAQERCTQDAFGTCLEFVWDAFRMCLGCAQDVLGICMEFFPH